MLAQGVLDCTHVHALEDSRVCASVAFLLSARHVSVDILCVFRVRNQSLRKVEDCPASREGKQGMVEICGSPVCVPLMPHPFHGPFAEVPCGP